MHLFTDYIQPLTLWLHDHPNAALLITFLVSLTESLAIIGSIIPGSVTMTAIGILAGSGVMRIDLTLLAAALGAIAGDGASYMIGYIFSDRLTSFWPFSHYPSLLSYGKDYFARHGGKSVLIGRFVGPLRSIIPVIAGMMHMSHLRFYIANIISAIAWAVLYVVPGVLIGTASSELSPEAATRLFVIILFVLAGIWLISAGVKWLLIRVNRFLRTKLHNFWLSALDNPYVGKAAKMLTPAEELNHYPTATLFVLFIFSSLLFCLVALMVCKGYSIAGINQSIHLLLQSLRTQSFDVFFIILAQIGSPLTLITLVISVVLVLSYYNDWRALFYWLSLCFCPALILLAFHFLINSPTHTDFLGDESYRCFPITELTVTTALFITILLYVNAYSQIRFKHLINTSLTLALFLVGFTPLYLGDNWLTDIIGSFLCGLSLSLLHWLLYRRKVPQQHYHPYIPLTVVALLFIASSISGIWTYRSSLREHQPYFAQYVFTEKLWWNQTTPILPVYRTNRLGHRISLFNLQYAGSLDNLTKTLADYGWQKQDDSFLNSILTRVSGQSTTAELPLMAQLYLNKKPALVMTYEPDNGNPMQVLRIWRSNYHLKHFKQPIWIGSIHPRTTAVNRQITNLGAEKTQSINYVSSALPLASFLQRRIHFPIQVSQKKLSAQVEPILLLLRETPKSHNATSP